MGKYVRGNVAASCIALGWSEQSHIATVLSNCATVLSNQSICNAKIQHASSRNDTKIKQQETHSYKKTKDAKAENTSLHDLSLIQILWWAGSWNKTSDYSLICNRGNRSLRGYLPPMISDQWRRCITDCQRHIPQSLNARSTSNVVVGGVSCPIIPLFCKTFEIGHC